MGYPSRTAAEAATPKYSIGEVVDLNTWVGMRYGFTVVDRKVVYHMRLGEYAWGYRVHKEGESTTFTFDYIPEGYLWKHKSCEIAATESEEKENEQEDPGSVLEKLYNDINSSINSIKSSSEG